jgi:hypothetical protein
VYGEDIININDAGHIDDRGLLGLMTSLVDEIYNAEKISILLNFSVIWYQNITFFITKPI